MGLWSLKDNDWPKLRHLFKLLFDGRGDAGLDNSSSAFSLPDNDWVGLRNILQRLFWCRCCDIRAFSLPVGDWVKVRHLLFRLSRCRCNRPASIWHINSDLELNWIYDTGDHCRDVHLDGSGNVFAAGNRANSKSVWKLNSSGVLIWDYDTGGTTEAVAAKDGSFVYITGGRVSSKDIWKLNADGTLNTSGGNGVTSGASIAVAVNTVCVGYYSTPGNEVIEYNDSLSFRWGNALDFNSTDQHDVILDASENVYFVGDANASGYTTHKYNTSGALQWRKYLGAGATGVAFNPAETLVYIALGAEVSGYSVRTVTSDGVTVADFCTTGSVAKGVAVDAAGNVYVSGTRNNNVGGNYYSVWKFNSSGTFVKGYDTTGNTYHIQVSGDGSAIVACGDRIT